MERLTTITRKVYIFQNCHTYYLIKYGISGENNKNNFNYCIMKAGSNIGQAAAGSARPVPMPLWSP